MRCQERESKGAGRSWLPPREAGSLVGGGNETRRHGWEEGGPRGRGRDEVLAEGAGLSYRTVQRGGWAAQPAGSLLLPVLPVRPQLGLEKT